MYFWQKSAQMTRRNKETMRPYWGTFTLVLFTILIFIIGFNALVDPDGRTDLVTLVGLNSVKTEPQRNSRVAEALAIKNCNYNYLLFGSSRANVGLNPDYAGFEGRPTFNAAANSANIIEISRIAEYAAEQQQPEAMIFGLDYIAFHHGREYSLDFYESRYALSPSFRGLIKHLFSRDTFFNSVRTLGKNLRGSINTCADNGRERFRDDLTSHRAAFNKTLKRTATWFSIYSYDPNRTKRFGQLLHTLTSQDIPVYLYISPFHALNLEVLEELNVLQDFIRWKQDLAKEINALNSRLPAARHITLWDFSGYNSITTEAVPLEDGIPMQWYFESSHYQPNVGDTVLDVILSKKKADNEAPEDFGTPLNEMEISEIAASSRVNRTRYRNENVDEIERLKVILKQVKSKTESQTDEEFMGGDISAIN
jgi:hypothetical protein